MNIREKILVIEDEKSIARFISTILTANGYDEVMDDIFCVNIIIPIP